MGKYLAEYRYPKHAFSFPWLSSWSQLLAALDRRYRTCRYRTGVCIYYDNLSPVTCILSAYNYLVAHEVLYALRNSEMYRRRPNSIRSKTILPLVFLHIITPFVCGCCSACGSHRTCVDSVKRENAQPG
jgi:hypothetical protein